MKTEIIMRSSFVLCLVSAGWIVADPHSVAGAILGVAGIVLYVWSTTEE